MEDSSENRDIEESLHDCWVPPPMIHGQCCLRMAQCSLTGGTDTENDHNFCQKFMRLTRNCLQSQCCGVYSAIFTFISIISVGIFFKDYHHGYDVLRPISICATVISFLFCCTFFVLRCYERRQNRYTYATIS